MTVIVVVSSQDQVFPAAVSVARALPLYSKKTTTTKSGQPKGPLAVRVVVKGAGFNPVVDYAALQRAAVCDFMLACSGVGRWFMTS